MFLCESYPHKPWNLDNTIFNNKGVNAKLSNTDINFDIYTNQLKLAGFILFLSLIIFMNLVVHFLRVCFLHCFYQHVESAFVMKP